MTQLERLAKPIPSGYIEQKPGSFAADYCAHHIITQILLKVCGPFSFEVQQVFYSPDGLLDGCTASLTARIDGREVTVTEAGDCANAKQKGSQGERLENAASSALKRCAMRLGLGLHLWAQEDYFLYDQLKHAAASSGGDEGRQESSRRDADNGVEPPVLAGPASRSSAPTSPGTRSPAPSPDEPQNSAAASPVGPNGDITLSPSSSDSAPPANDEATGEPVGANQLQRIKSKITLLRAHDVPVADARMARGLPAAKAGISREDADEWETLLIQLEHDYKVVAPA